MDHEQASPVLRRIAERLPDTPVMVFSRCGEVLWRTRPAIGLTGVPEVAVTGHRHLGRYRHAEVGELELYRQLLVDREAGQVLLVLTAEPGSPSDRKLRRLTGD